MTSSATNDILELETRWVERIVDMFRKNYLVTTFSEIALEQFQMLRENYQKLESLKIMCGEAVELRHEICSTYVATITFAAMALEAFLNDYAARNMGDKLFYDNFENLRPAAKLQLISKIVFNTTVDTGGKVFSFMDQLFKERNTLVHCKSQNARGMSEEEYESYQQFLEIDENAESWLIMQAEKLDIAEEKKLMGNAHNAVRALKEVASYIDSHDDCAYAMTKLVCSGWHVDSFRNKYRRIKESQKYLGVTPIICPDNK